MRNRALDRSADRTDLVIVFVLTHVEFTVLWLLSRRDVARPLKSLVCDNRSGKVENLFHLAFPLLHVMVTSGSRVICFASSASGRNSSVACAISRVNSAMISETVPWETPKRSAITSSIIFCRL